MPTGMLSPLGSSQVGAVSVGTPAERLTLARGKTAGEWAELQVAQPGDTAERRALARWHPDSRFLSLDAMTLLHEPFARALPGFDLFLPRLFDGPALGRLRAELERSKVELRSMPMAVAKARWAGASPLIASLPDEDAWIAARAALLSTIDTLTDLAKALETKTQRLWVLAL